MISDKTAGQYSTQAVQAGLDKHPVLIVDDDPSFRRILQFALELLGYPVLAAGGVDDALEVASQNRDIQLLITDVAMPVMNGAEMARKIREMQPGVEVLYVSGFPLQAMEGMGVATDSKHFLQKPFPPAVLQGRIKAILGAQ